MSVTRKIILSVLLLLSHSSFAKGLFDAYVQDESQKAELKQDREHLLSDETRALRGKTITKITISGIKNEQQANNAHSFLGLSRIENEKIRQPDYAQYLITNGIKEIQASQQPFGYYHVEVIQKLISLDDDNLEIQYRVKLGDPIRVKNVSIKIVGQGKNTESFKALADQLLYDKNAILNDVTYEDFKKKFANLASKEGYFDGAFKKNQILVDTDKNEAEIKLIYDTGVRYKYGSFGFKNAAEGSSQDIFTGFPNHLPLDVDFLQRYLHIQEGQFFKADDIATLQQSLQSGDYFRQVIIQANPDKTNKIVPIESLLTMNKKRSYLLGLGFSTDNGINGKYNYDQRWMNSKGHTFYSHLAASEKTANFDNMYKFPAQNPITDYYYLRAGITIESDTYNNQAIYTEGGYNWQSGKWEQRLSLTDLYSKFSVGYDKNTTFVLYPSYQATYTSTKNRLNPRSGFQLQTLVRGSAHNIGSGVSFLQTNLNLRYLYPLNEKNRVVLRMDTGAVMTNNYHRLPPRFRYFTGGDRAIRGYSYQDIGPRDGSGDNVGGKYLAVGSVEYEYYVKPDWAIAAFVDGGDAFSRTFSAKYGAGLGVHWRSPVGPIRIDFAHGFDKDYGEAFKIHLSIGTELNL